MTFRNYLASRKPRHNRGGDFIRLALRDKNLPVIETLPELRSYITRTHALATFADEAEAIWGDYIKFINGAPLEPKRR